MLPDCRPQGEPFSLPIFDVVPREGEGFMDELRTFQSAFHDGVARREPRAHFFDYMVGQCSARARKSIAPMALAVEGGTIRGLQCFIRDDTWDDEPLRWTYHPLGADDLGAPGGVLMCDESGFVKKGQESVGVARQYGGSLGKGEHAHVGVCAA